MYVKSTQLRELPTHQAPTLCLTTAKILVYDEIIYPQLKPLYFITSHVISLHCLTLYCSRKTMLMSQITCSSIEVFILPYFLEEYAGFIFWDSVKS